MDKTGWLIDLYPDETGLALWFLCDGGQRLCLRMNFPVTFYAAGHPASLREAWSFLQEKQVGLARETHRDLFTGQRDLLVATIAHPVDLPRLFAEFSQHFP